VTTSTVASTHDTATHTIGRTDHDRQAAPIKTHPIAADRETMTTHAPTNDVATTRIVRTVNDHQNVPIVARPIALAENHLNAAVRALTTIHTTTYPVATTRIGRTVDDRPTTRVAHHPNADNKVTTPHAIANDIIHRTAALSPRRLHSFAPNYERCSRPSTSSSYPYRRAAQRSIMPTSHASIARSPTRSNRRRPSRMAIFQRAPS